MVLDGTLSLDWFQSWKNTPRWPEKNQSIFYFQLEVDWPQSRKIDMSKIPIFHSSTLTKSLQIFEGANRYNYNE